MIRNRFNEILLKTGDFEFNSLGESCRKAVYFYLKTTFQIKKREAADETIQFHDALRLIFKDGAVFLERLIPMKLCESWTKVLRKTHFGFCRQYCSDYECGFRWGNVPLSVSNKESILVNHKGRRKK